MVAIRVADIYGRVGAFFVVAVREFHTLPLNLFSSKHSFLPFQNLKYFIHLKVLSQTKKGVNQMKYFEQYVSNTIAGSANHLYFTMGEGEIRTGRVFYKITCGGEYNYAILYSNIMDSTFGDGSISHQNLVCDSWMILGARVGICKSINQCKDVHQMTVADAGENKDADIIVSDFREMTFAGKRTKEVMPGEFFTTDPVKLSFEKDDYMCIEMTYSGKMIPYHEDSILPIYNKTENGWEFCKKMPMAGMVGCDRKVVKRIGYLGDSITQGVGTEYNKYAHWNALLTEQLGDDFAGWNLGIGYARANDTASDGAWMFKAKQNDIVVMCLGINDIGRGFPAEQIKKDLSSTLQTLKRAGIKVVLQSLPPYSGLNETQISKWKEVTAYIKNSLAKEADLFFDVAPHLYVSKDTPTESLYNPHPNAAGCKVWAEALYNEIKGFLEKETQL